MCDLRHLVIREPRPKPIRTGQQYIPCLQLLHAGNAHVRHRRIATDTTFNEVAHRVIKRFLFSNSTFLDQHFNVTVIAGPRQDLAVAQLVYTAIADVRPKRSAFLHQADSAGCARPKIDRNITADSDNLVVRR